MKEEKEKTLIFKIKKLNTYFIKANEKLNNISIKKKVRNFLSLNMLLMLMQYDKFVRRKILCP